MNQLPISARFYVVAMICAAVGLFMAFGEVARPAEMPVYVGLAIGMIAAATLKLRLPTTKNRATMSMSFVIDFASLLLFGPHKTMLIAAIGAVSQSTIHAASKNPVYRVLFNMACLMVSVEAAGAVYRLGGGLVGVSGSWQHPMAIMTATVVHFLVSSIAIGLAVALSTSQPLRRVWEQNFLWGAPGYFIGAVVSVLIAELVSRQMWGFLPVAAIAMYIIHQAFVVYAGRLEDEHRHREVIESLNEGMAVIHRDGRIADWNDALERIFAVSRERALGRSLIEALPSLAGTSLPQVINTVIEQGQAITLDRFNIQHDGRGRILQLRIFPFMRGVTVFWNDITERAQAEAALRQSEERYALAAAGSNDGLWDWDLTRGEIYFSQRWKEMIGLAPQTPLSHPDDWFGRVHHDDVAKLRAALDAHVAGETGHFAHEYRIRHADGWYRSVFCRGAAVRHADGRAIRIAGSQTDITDRTAVQEQLLHAALHDALTGLPNRAAFMERLEAGLDRAGRHPDHRFAVLFLDIDRFKIVNDSVGHLVGDELLIAVTRRLQGCLRDGDVLARLGGDEFTILLHNVDSGQACHVAQRMQESLRDRFMIRGHEVFVSASIGIALSSSGYTNAQDIMRDADTAMYHAKALGKARHEMFDASMHAGAVNRLNLERDLRRAIERRELTLQYQPIVSLESGEWTGLEALLRWQRDGRFVPPSEFIPVAEETGIIEPLGAWVLREACRQLGVWLAMFPGGPELGVTVNVSTRQLTQPDFVATVTNAVTGSGLKPKNLRLEITETALMDNSDRAKIVLDEIRALGVKVYLDDFGTGFSSLSYLHRFQVDTLKIDRSFITGLTVDRERPAFVESIVAFANTLGIPVIAEGVETDVQLNELKRLGCAEAQGYLFSEPLTPPAAEALLAKRTAPKRAFQVVGKSGKSAELSVA